MNLVDAPLDPDGAAASGGGALRDRWSGLLTLVWARLLVATIALPIGILFRPDATAASRWVLCWSLLALGAASALFWLGVRIRRGLVLQSWLQVGTDLAIVTALAALTGGRDSQFVLFFGLVVISGGLFAGVSGGVAMALAACLSYAALPALANGLHAPTGSGAVFAVLPPGMVIAYFTMMGVLAGALGARVRRTREQLERTARELDRVRVDNDVILRHLTTGVLTVDSQGKVAYLNPAAEQVLRVRALECRGRDLAAALPERLQQFRALILTTLEQRTPRARAELQLTNQSGRPLPLGISTSLLMHQDRTTGVVAVFQDLTEVREMERRARRNETLAELGALSARIAHELRNGLNPISGSVECLQRELKVDGENAVLMDLIARECVRLNRFVTDLLNFSRERDLALEPLDLDAELAELCETMTRDPRCGPGIALKYERGDCQFPVRADREQIRQVWLNLAVNAFEAMNGEGTLVVRGVAGEEGLCAVEFQDDGPGIAAEDLPRVGQPFFTTKQGGTGLGLAIAQRIVERHGGSLSFESRPGRGTTVRVTLPADAPVVAKAA